jgi:hypothetical protein
MQFNKSLSLDLRKFKGKKFKVMCDMVRSAVKQEHGYRSTKGLTDSRLKKWSIAIRFSNEINRNNFISSLEQILSVDSLSKMKFKMLKPKAINANSTRFIRQS